MRHIDARPDRRQLVEHIPAHRHDPLDRVEAGVLSQRFEVAEEAGHERQERISPASVNLLVRKVRDDRIQ